MSKKAVFFDIDGTLWDKHFVIPKSTREAIAALRANGHYAFLCSGRTRAFIRDENLLSLGFDGILSGCGTQIEYQGETLFYKRLEQELIQKTVHILRENKAAVIYEGRYKLYLDKEDFHGDSYVERLCEAVGEDVKTVAGNEDRMEISKFSCYAAEEIYERIVPLLNEDYKELMHTSRVAEFVPKGFSKASGIARTCELLSIAHKDTYAFGDSINDVEMLKYVEHGIVMGNGTETAKEAGDYITTSIYENGIYNGLAHFGLI